MDHARAVRAVERVGDLRAEAHELGRGRRRGAGARRAFSPSTSSMTEVHLAPRPTSNSVQMFGWLSPEIVRASRSKRAHLGVVGEVLGQHLDRDFSTEAGVARPVHFAHAAGAERRDHFLRAELRSGFEHARRPP